MSETTSPIVFTPEEQLDLQRLEQNRDLFTMLKNLLQQGIFLGAVAVPLAQCQQLAEQLIANTNQQIDSIKKNAADRSNPAAKAN